MTRIINFSAPLGHKAGHGHWNDLDMLEVGNGGMTFDEYGERNGGMFPAYSLADIYLLLLRSDTLLDVGTRQEPTHSRK